MEEINVNNKHTTGLKTHRIITDNPNMIRINFINILYDDFYFRLRIVFKYVKS